jgi:hypothetical protein
MRAIQLLASCFTSKCNSPTQRPYARYSHTHRKATDLNKRTHAVHRLFTPSDRRKAAILKTVCVIVLVWWWVRFPTEARIFSVLQNVQTGSGTLLLYYWASGTISERAKRPKPEPEHSDVMPTVRMHKAVPTLPHTPSRSAQGNTRTSFCRCTILKAAAVLVLKWMENITWEDQE